MASAIRPSWPFIALLLATAGCSGTQVADTLGWGTCPEYRDEYTTALQAGGSLASSIPTDANRFPMALVLSQHALNSLFQRLSDTDLPELSESATVLGQELRVSVQPAIPLLQIGGQGACADCIRADLPFDVGLSMTGLSLPRGAGAISVQMPIRLVPEGDARTALVAQFQSIEVLGLDLDLGSELASNILGAAEPLISAALTSFLRSRFADARIVTLDSWSIGSGEVLLAGRGPLVFPDAGTVMIAMQSNLPLEGGTQLAALSQLPEGADLGVVIHPGLLSAMGRRMLYEGVIPQRYDARGNADEQGSTRLTLQSVSSDDAGLLRATSTLWQTGSLCGAADLSAAIAFSADPSGVRFAVRDVSVTNGRGAGQLLTQTDQMAGSYLASLLQTLELTVNYDEMLGGEQGDKAAVQTAQVNVDGRGVSLFLDLVD